MPNKNIEHLLQNRRWSELSDYLLLIPNNSDNPLFHYAKGMLVAYGSDKDNNLHLAILHIKKACELDTDNAKFLNILSEMLLSTKEFKEAHSVAQHAATSFPDNPMCSIALARSFLAQKNEVSALKNFTAALSHLTDNHASLKENIRHSIFKLPSVWTTPIVGKRLTLNRVKPYHFSFFFNFRNNDTFRNQYNFFQQKTEKAIRNDIAKSQKSPLESNKVEWVIEKDGTAIGIASLVDINLRNCRAELLIGFPSNYNGWESLEATLLILEFAFKTIQLDKVYSYVYSDNMQSQKNTLHLGFTQEGILRSHVKRPDTLKPLDIISNGYLSEEFFHNAKIQKLFKRTLGRPLTREG